MQFNDDSSYVRGLLFVPPVYVANFNKSINRDLNDENKTQQPFISLFYIAIAYNSIHDLTAQLHSEWCVIGPLETVQKRASTLFTQVKITSCCVRDSIEFNQPRQWSEQI